MAAANALESAILLDHGDDDDDDLEELVYLLSVYSSGEGREYARASDVRVAITVALAVVPRETR